jgi:uncharacterized protein (TIGR03085 family)
MTSFAQSERAALSELFLEVGPDAPTLCEGWDARDLAAHLVVRERRPDAAVGIVVKPLAGHLDSVQHGLAHGDYDRLVATVRSGPPFPLTLVDAQINTAEYFVHHEDVRRAQDGWEPRDLDPRLESALWKILRMQGRMLFRHSSVGVALRRPDGTTHVARGAEPMVTLVGPASELLLYAFGRTAHARVTIEGDPDAVTAFEGVSLGL